MQFGCSTTERDGPSTTPPEYRTQCGFGPVGGAVWAVGGERPELHATGDDDARVGACSQPRVCEWGAVDSAPTSRECGPVSKACWKTVTETEEAEEAEGGMPTVTRQRREQLAPGSCAQPCRLWTFI